MSQPWERWEITYSGHVQGVGFRQTAWSIARRYAVEGYVQNLDDGRVHLEIQGPRDEVDRCLSELEQVMGRRIHEAVRTARTDRADWSGFVIRP